MSDTTRPDHRTVSDNERLSKRVDLWGRGQSPLYITEALYARLDAVSADWTARCPTRMAPGIVARALLLGAGCSYHDAPDTLRATLDAALPS